MTIAAPATTPAPTPQQGITNRPPEHLLMAAFAFGTDRTATVTRETIARLRLLIAHELQSELDTQDATTPKDAPSPETGELGFRNGYDRQFLTVTVGLGPGAFEALGVAAARPAADSVGAAGRRSQGDGRERRSGVASLC
jgi:deferrochelatase/peroxidase EfeB